MYVKVCTHLFKLTPTMCLLKMSLQECFYRFSFRQGRGGHKGSIVNGLPHQFNDFLADTKQSQINYESR